MLSSEIAEILLDKKAVKISIDPPFTWTSGLKSPIYCDNRKLISHLDAIEKIIQAYENLIIENNLEFHYIAGTATAGIPWASFLAYKLEKPMVYVRSKPKGHGAGKQVEGDTDFLKGKTALIVEDLFSTGGSSINTAEALKKELDSKIEVVLSIFTYNFQKCLENFQKARLNHYSITNFEILLQKLVERGDFGSEQKDLILKFSQNPEIWFDNLK